MTVRFVDTSVLCNLLPVPGKDQHADEIKAELVNFIESDDTLILPITAIIETGNFIAQLSGGLRRATAERLDAQLRLAASNEAPYIFHDFAWSPAFISDFLDGAHTGMNFIDHATAGLGGGDLCILTEVNAYRRRSGIPNVSIWTRDVLLNAYA